jgi:prophage DNA circulation protein
MNKRWYHRFLTDYEVLIRLDCIARTLETIMAVQQDIKDALDKLTADVAAETTVNASMLVYVKGLKDQIQALADATKDTTTAQALQALATQIEVNAKNDAEAMSANTDTPPATPPVDPAPAPFDPAPDFKSTNP